MVDYSKEIIEKNYKKDQVDKVRNEYNNLLEKINKPRNSYSEEERNKLYVKMTKVITDYIDKTGECPKEYKWNDVDPNKNTAKVTVFNDGYDFETNIKIDNKRSKKDLPYIERIDFGNDFDTIENYVLKDIKSKPNKIKEYKNDIKHFELMGKNKDYISLFDIVDFNKIYIPKDQYDYFAAMIYQYNKGDKNKIIVKYNKDGKIVKIDSK